MARRKRFTPVQPAPRTAVNRAPAATTRASCGPAMAPGLTPRGARVAEVAGPVTVKGVPAAIQQRLLPLCLNTLGALGDLPPKVTRELATRLLISAAWVDGQTGMLTNDDFARRVVSQEAIAYNLREGPFRHWSASSRATVRSSLTRIGVTAAPGLHPLSEPLPRREATAPHTDVQRSQHYTAADAVDDLQLRTELLTWLDLTYRCGLRATEARDALGNWIRERDGQVWVELPVDDVARPRMIPVTDAAAAARLRRHSAQAGTAMLLRPHLNGRKNVGYTLTAALRADSRAGDFAPVAARHLWVVELLQTVPFSVFVQLAGLRAESKQVFDLLPWMPHYSDAELLVRTRTC